MALVKTNQGFSLTTPGGSAIQFNYNQPAGADGFLMALVMFKNRTTNIPVPTYNSVSMVKLFEYNNNNFRVAAYGLLTPSTGTNQFRIAGSGQWNPTSVILTSFTGSSGFGVRNQNLTNASPSITTLNGLTSGSIVQGYGMGLNTQATASVQIPSGTAVTREWRHNVSGWFWGGTSATLTTSTTTARLYSGVNWADSRSGAIEIKASSVAPPTRRRRIIIN